MILVIVLELNTINNIKKKITSACDTIKNNITAAT